MRTQRIVLALIVANLLEATATGAWAQILYNAALYKPAYQSSTQGTAAPERGNDGSRHVTSFQWTLTDSPAWWMVDLLKVHVIERIFLTNNLVQYYADMLHSFQIDIFTTDPRETPGFPNISGEVCYIQTSTVGMGNYTWPCPAPMEGRYVRIVKTVVGELAVLELEVHARHQERKAMNFKAYQNQRYVWLSPFNFLTTEVTSSWLECTTSCLRLLAADRGDCNAANWTPVNGECEMFILETRNRTAVMSRMFPRWGTIVYINELNMQT